MTTPSMTCRENYKGYERTLRYVHSQTGFSFSIDGQHLCRTGDGTMDTKYVGKIVALPKEVADKLEEFRANLSISLGFKVSHSQAIAHLLRNAEPEQTK